MATFKVLQIISTGSHSDAEQELRRNTIFQPTREAILAAWDMYEVACYIKAEDCDEVFEIGNNGPEEHIERVGRMHSISVGDVIVDVHYNVAWYVDSCDFGSLGTVHPTIYMERH
jgi:hypothetical protein